jgi:deoxyribose-phosphate aldolase
VLSSARNAVRWSLPVTHPKIAPLQPAEIARLIDHTILKPEATREDIRKLCEEALRFNFATVCVNPGYVSDCVRMLAGSAVKVCTVAGFPLGATLPDVKAYEAGECIGLGAKEIDMVISIGALKSGDDHAVEADIRGVVDVCRRGGAICKVILETALLTADEKVRAALAARRAGADFVKTSTGFGPGGATAEDVRLLRETVGAEMGVKASGRVRSLADLLRMVEAGATRIGTSSGAKIIGEASDAGSRAAVEVQ